MLSYTGMVYVLSCRGFLDAIVHRDGVCFSLEGGFLIIIVDGMCSLLYRLS